MVQLLGLDSHDRTFTVTLILIVICQHKSETYFINVEYRIQMLKYIIVTQEKDFSSERL